MHVRCSFPYSTWRRQRRRGRWLVHVRSSSVSSAHNSTSAVRTSHKLKWSRRNFVARRCHANDTRGSPSTVSTFERSSHDTDNAGAVKRVIHTPLSHFHNVLLDRLVPELGTVDTVRSSESHCGFEFGWINVHGNDATCTSDFGSLNDSKTLRKRINEAT